MAMELDVIGLSEDQRIACRNTIGPNTFFMLVADALVSRNSLSVVRMGDGEKQLFHYCQTDFRGRVRNQPFGEQWLREFGCFDIPCGEMLRRLALAAEECTYFSPQIMGIQRDQWRIAWLSPRDRFVDNWFVRTWSRQLQNQLLQAAGHVLFIHGKPEVTSAFRSRSEVPCDVLEMSSWEQAESVIAAAAGNQAPLVLFSGGPANKYIGPKIATSGCRPKVVLDLGQAAAKEWI